MAIVVCKWVYFSKEIIIHFVVWLSRIWFFYLLNWLITKKMVATNCYNMGWSELYDMIKLGLWVFLKFVCVCDDSMKTLFSWNGYQTLWRILSLVEASLSTNKMTLPSRSHHPIISSRHQARFLYSRAAAPALGIRMCLRVQKVLLQGGEDVLEASVLALQHSILVLQFNLFPLLHHLLRPCSPLLPLRAVRILRISLSHILWLSYLNKFRQTIRRKRKSNYQFHWLLRRLIKIHLLKLLGNACIVRLLRHHSGEQDQWGQKPFAMLVVSGTSLAGFSLNTGLQRVQLLFHCCTPIPIRRFLRWETRLVIRWLLWPGPEQQRPIHPNSSRLQTAAFRWITCEGGSREECFLSGSIRLSGSLSSLLPHVMLYLLLLFHFFVHWFLYREAMGGENRSK